MPDIISNLNKIDKYVYANLVKDITTKLIDSKMKKMDEQWRMVNLINILMM